MRLPALSGLGPVASLWFPVQENADQSHHSFLRFCPTVFKVLGRDDKWDGGSYMGAPGGGQKVRLLKSALEELDNQDRIILFTDR